MDRLERAIADAKRRYEAMTPEQRKTMWDAQRESWVRAFAPCEHDELDWETCADCLAEAKNSTNSTK